MLLAVILTSCGEDKAHRHDDEDHAVHSETAQKDAVLNKLSLNGTAKWKMDAHTRSVFARMAERFNNLDYASLEGEGLKQAASTLQSDIKELIRGCTMSGEEHDQLHLFLTGYMPAVTALEESGRVEDALKVQHYLKKYTDYFE